MAEIWMSAEEFKKRQETLEYMKGKKRMEIAEQIGIARGFGDLSENAEYDAAKDLQAKNEHDIAQLEEELRNAKIIDESSGGDTVKVGSYVVVYNKTLEKEAEYHLVGSAEADPFKGNISNESPIGKALIGHKTGDEIEISTPGGVVHMQVLSLRFKDNH